MPGSPITLFLPLSPWQRCSSLPVINVTCCCTRVRSHQQPADRFFASRAPKQKKTAITPGLMKYAFPLLHFHCSTVYTVGSSHLFVFPPTDSSELFYFFHLDCFSARLKPDCAVFNKEFPDILVTHVHILAGSCVKVRSPFKNESSINDSAALFLLTCRSCFQ